MNKVNFVVYVLDEKYQFLDLIVHDKNLETLKEKLSKETYTNKDYVNSIKKLKSKIIS